MHYMLPATRRLEAFDVELLIQQSGYFVVHAPRQVGKTTAMLALAKELTESGEYVAAVVSLETGAAYPDDPLKAEQAILTNWKISIRAQLPAELYPPIWVPETYGGAVTSLSATVNAFCHTILTLLAPSSLPLLKIVNSSWVSKQCKRRTTTCLESTKPPIPMNAAQKLWNGSR